jgi:polyisoprenoid-binding protein YceI
MTRILPILALAAGLVVTGRAETSLVQTPGQRPALAPNQWLIDTSHSAASFSVRHMMVSTVRGQLGPIAGTIEYDGKDVRSIKADVRIDVKGLTTQNAKRDDHLRSDDFFDAATHPVLTFKSKRVEPGAAGQFKLVGDLTIRGTTKEVVLDVEGPNPIVKDRAGIRTGATATTKVKRLEYGLKYNSMIEAGPVVGDDVTITIDIELMRPAPPGTTQP